MPTHRRGKTPLLSVSTPLSVVSFPLDVSAHGLECIVGAAYLMMDRAYVWIEGDRNKNIKISMKKKVGGTAAQLRLLAREFHSELETQKVRWAIAKNNRPIRQHVMELSVLLAGGSGPGELARVATESTA